jgi:periplasmic protein CpxP/Spy
MKSIRFRFLAAALAVMLSAAIAKSQTTDAAPPPPAMPGPVHDPGMFGIGHPLLQFYAKELGITDDQKIAMRAILQKERTTLHPLMQQMHQLDDQLKPYVQGTYDGAKVQALVSAQAQTMVQLKIEEARIHNELYQMLTPDQQAKLKQIQAERETRMQQRMQNAAASDSEQEQ